jgi:hypothetical protein
MAIKDKLLALTLPRQEVAVPELGGETVWVWGLSGAERDGFEATMTEQRGKKRVQNLANIRARFLVLVLRDADGKRLFTDAEAGVVGNLPASVLDRLFDVGRKLSGMTEADVEELGKGSESDRPAPSLSASSENSAG